MRWGYNLQQIGWKWVAIWNTLNGSCLFSEQWRVHLAVQKSLRDGSGYLGSWIDIHEPDALQIPTLKYLKEESKIICLVLVKAEIQKSSNMLCRFSYRSQEPPNLRIVTHGNITFLLNNICPGHDILIYMPNPVLLFSTKMSFITNIPPSVCFK